MQDFRSSFLHIPIELRILILRHVFAESKVVIGARYLPCWQTGYSKLETGILLTCKQLHKEGQELLASSTRLEVYYKGYSFDRIPNNVCLDYEYVSFIKHLTLLIGYYDTDEFCFQPQQLPGLEFLQLIGLCENHDETVGSSALSLGEWNGLMQGGRDRLIIDTWALCVETCEGIPKWLADYVRKPATCPFEIIIQYTDRTRFEIRQEDASAGHDTATHRKTVILELHFNALTREVIYRKCLNDDYHGSGLCPKRYLVDRWLLEKHEDGGTVDSGRSEYGFVYDDWVIGLEDNPWAGLGPRFPNRHLAVR